MTGLADAKNLDQYNQFLDQQTRAKIQEIESNSNNTCINIDRYEFNILETEIQKLIGELTDNEHIHQYLDQIRIEFISREMFEADITIRFSPDVLREMKGEFAQQLLPQLYKEINEKIQNGDQLGQKIKDIEQKGIYLNASLQPAYLLSMCQQIHEFGYDYGTANIQDGKRCLVEYSSPNAAKHLHAGHVRSTVLGHIIANISEQVGYQVHRLNHINDWGGFGQLIEGYDRRHQIIADSGLSGNDLNFKIYQIYRSAEKAYKGEARLDELSGYFDTSDIANFQKDYEQYISDSNQRFHQLTSGSEKEFEIRKQILQTSMIEFETFYKLLNIDHDYSIGESFYEKIGKEVLDQARQKGLVVKFDTAMAEQYLNNYLTANPDASDQVRERKELEIKKDIGSELVLLDNRERYVVLRADGATIYATRDLGAIFYRCQTRDPATIIYEVGQEQKDHFNKLFETAHKLDRSQDKEFLHIYHGFYVNAQNKQKLSSREGASNVIALISSTIAYFKDKYKDKPDFEASEVEKISKTLGIGSIIINDIGQKRTDSVAIHPDINQAIEGFEQSGGAYMLYGVCRAKSLINKATVNFDREQIKNTEITLTDKHNELVKQLVQFPSIVIKSAENFEPSILVHHMYQLTQTFNSLYNSSREIVKDPLSLYLVSSYIKVMTKALAICNIEALEKI